MSIPNISTTTFKDAGKEAVKKVAKIALTLFTKTTKPKK